MTSALNIAPRNTPDILSNIMGPDTQGHAASFLAMFTALNGAPDMQSAGAMLGRIAPINPDFALSISDEISPRLSTMSALSLLQTKSSSMTARAMR